MTSLLERTEGAGRDFFNQVGAEPGDVIILVSTSGRNAFPIEMAMAAREAGLKVVGVTSITFTTAVTSRHSSGKKMYEYCDIVLDNLTIPGDAVLEDERLPQKVGPTSGWIGCFILQALMACELGRLATAIIKRLGMQGDEFVVVPFGGVFKAGELVLGTFRDTVLAVSPRALVIRPRFEPVVGAVLLALDELGVEIGRPIIDAIERSSTGLPACCVYQSREDHALGLLRTQK